MWYRRYGRLRSPLDGAIGGSLSLPWISCLIYSPEPRKLCCRGDFNEINTSPSPASHTMNAPPQLYKSQSLEDAFLTLTPPKTPETDCKPIHSWPEPETVPEEILRQHLSHFETGEIQPHTAEDTFNVTLQNVLLLHGAKQRYMHTGEQRVPGLENDREMLVAVNAIGLNPIDWKAP